MCENCGKRLRWWFSHYVHGILPGYICDKALRAELGEEA